MIVVILLAHSSSSTKLYNYDSMGMKVLDRMVNSIRWLMDSFWT